MRFPLVIPPLLLLILNWPSLDSDAVTFHNGSFVSVNSLDHVQFANISSIDGNFATRNTRFRKSSTDDVKPLALADSYGSSEDTVPTSLGAPQDSRGKRQKRDSEEDELAQAEKNVTDLTSEISKISQELKEKEEEASEANKKYEETKNEWDRQVNLLEVWKEWEAAAKTAKRAERELSNAEIALNRTKDEVAEAENKLQRVKDEPETLKNLTRDIPLEEKKEKELNDAIDAIDIEELTRAVTFAQGKYNSKKSEVDRHGCNGPGKESDSSCTDDLTLLKKYETQLENANNDLSNGKRDLPIKTEELRKCKEKLQEMRANITQLTTSVENNQILVGIADKNLKNKKSAQEKAQEKYGIALKSRKDAYETLENKEAAKTKAEESGAGNRADIEAAMNSADMKFDKANTIKERIDNEIEHLKTTLEGKNGELALATAELNTLKQRAEQEKKDKPKTGATMYIGIGVGGGLLLIILIIGGILFAVKRRKSKKKVEPSPTIDPDALKYEKVPILDKLAQQSITQSNSTQRATSAKSDTNVSATQSSSNQRAIPAKSDTNVAETPNCSTPGVAAKSNTNKKKMNISDLGSDLKGQPDDEYKPKPIINPDKTGVQSAPAIKHETVSDSEITPIKRLLLVNELAKPNSSSSKPGGCDLPKECTKLKWAKEKVLAMPCGDEVLEPLPDDEMLHAEQDEEAIDDGDDTLYERSTKDETKTDSTLLEGYKNKNRLTVDEALKLNKTCLVAVHRKLHFPYTKLMQKLATVMEIFKGEKRLARCGVPATVFGDIHGQSGDLVRIMTLAAYDPANPDSSRVLDLNKERFVFCGDYVDRGNRSLEVLTILLTMKIAYPNNVLLVRGNHETREVNRKYGFYDDLRKRYCDDDPEQVENLYDAYNEVFDYMPIACIVGGKVMCTHAGISRHLNRLEDIDKIPKPLSIMAAFALALDLMWSDPSNKLAGFKPNKKRGISEYFGEDVLKQMMVKLGLIMWITGHRIPSNGFALFGMLGIFATVFTAINASKGKKNSGACIKIFANGEMQGRVIHKCPNAVFHLVLHEMNNKNAEDYPVHNPEQEPTINYNNDETICADGTRL